MTNPPWIPQYVVMNNIPFSRALCHDGHLVTANGTDELVKSVTKYLRTIDYRPPNFLAYFQTAVCRAIPGECNVCRFVDESAPAEIRAPRVLRMADMMHFLDTMAKWLASGLSLVSTAQAQQRADTCRRCPENQEVTGCSGCSGFASKIGEKLGSLKLKGVSDLQGCRICGCGISAMVWLPLETLGEPTDHPWFCWQKQERLPQQDSDDHAEAPE